MSADPIPGATLRSVRELYPATFQGRVELLDVDSAVLADNALGDPAVRELPVYLPPGDDGAAQELPLVVVLPGYTGNGRNWFDPHPWFTGWLVRYDRAVAAGERPPARVAVPDCLTRLGGSQYVDSPAVGAYETHVTRELVPLLLERYRGSTGRLAVAGKSSGGFGALRLAMRHGGLFQACASISGDCAFDQHYPHEFLGCLRGLVKHGGDPAAALAAFAAKPDLSGDGHAVVYTLACAACYSPSAQAPLGFDLPFDLETGELVEAVWRRWLEHDPLEMVADHADALRDLRLLWIECGLADEFHLQWGARRLSRALHAAKVPHEHEEHPGGHRGIDERYLVVLDALGAALG